MKISTQGVQLFLVVRFKKLRYFVVINSLNLFYCRYRRIMLLGDSERENNNGWISFLKSRSKGFEQLQYWNISNYASVTNKVESDALITFGFNNWNGFLVVRI